MSTPSKPIAAYIRVSTKDQNTDGQRESVQSWLTGNGIDPSKVEWYTDKESGRTLRRPEFERMQADIFAGRIKTVVVFKVDRVSRRIVEGLETLSKWCEQGIRFVSTTQQIDVSGTMGKMVAAIMLGFAELELEYRAERQKAGIAVAKRQGVYTGRKPGTTHAKPERAKELRDNGLTAPEIAEAMSVSLRTVYRYLGDA
jgi:DNA invertase Pin-like site-specific DNA recombinase